MNLEKLYYEVKGYIDRVDFSKLWCGFEPLKFALYNAEECFFDGEYVAKTDEFLGNTAISYNGEMIAIWNVSGDTDSIILASKLIHEMFHGFQGLNNESRFPDELDALYSYKYSDENLSMKLEENRLIAELVERFETNKLERLLEIRKYRYNHFNCECHYEACIEQIEGTAQFVELKALKQLSCELYREKLTTLIKRITKAENLLPIRIACYDIGALLLLILDENGIGYESGFVNTPFSESLIADAVEYAGHIELTMGKVIDGYYEKADTIISEAIAKGDVVSECTSNILGVNVYNAVYYNNHIISRYFVMYGDVNSPKIEYGDFVIETDEPKKMSRLYRF